MGWYSQGTQVVDFIENAGRDDRLQGGRLLHPGEREHVGLARSSRSSATPTARFTYCGRDRRLQPRRAGPQRDRRLQGHAAGAARAAGRHGHRGRAGPGLAGGRVRGRALRDRRRVPPRRRQARRRRGLRLELQAPELALGARGRVPPGDGRSIRALKRVKSFRSRKRPFTWKARGVRNGTYVVRFRTSLAGGSADLRRIAVQRRKGRFTVRPAFQRARSCTNLLGAFRLNRPVFGGRQKRALFASFRLNAAADVKLTVTRGARSCAPRSASATRRATAARSGSRRRAARAATTRSRSAPSGAAAAPRRRSPRGGCSP